MRRPSGLCWQIFLIFTLPTVSDSMALVFGSDDALFGHIEQQHHGRNFGKILDAGTGQHSLRWIATLLQQPSTHVTAVTADESMQRNCQRELQRLGVEDHQADVVIGNWFSDNKSIHLEEQSFDTILADYLIGAMDGFSPYKQDQMIPLLAKYLKPGGRLYIVGLQPIPDSTGDKDANIICRVRQVRDACILLAGHRCYREYPQEWIEQQIQNTANLKLVHSQQFPIIYRHETIVKQINVGRTKLPYFTPDLKESMGMILDDLEQQSLAATQRRGGKISLGFDYVISSERVD